MFLLHNSPHLTKAYPHGQLSRTVFRELSVENAKGQGVESRVEGVFDRFFRYSVECTLGWRVRSVYLTIIWKPVA
jgi:hypothetical protein